MLKLPRFSGIVLLVLGGITVLIALIAAGWLFTGALYPLVAGFLVMIAGLLDVWSVARTPRRLEG